MEKYKYIIDLDGFFANSPINFMRDFLVDDVYYHKHRSGKVTGVVTVNDCAGVNFDVKFEAKQRDGRLINICLPYSESQLRRNYQNNLDSFLNH